MCVKNLKSFLYLSEACLLTGAPDFDGSQSIFAFLLILFSFTWFANYTGKGNNLPFGGGSFILFFSSSCSIPLGILAILFTVIYSLFLLYRWWDPGKETRPIGVWSGDRYKKRRKIIGLVISIGMKLPDLPDLMISAFSPHEAGHYSSGEGHLNQSYDNVVSSRRW